MMSTFPQIAKSKHDTQKKTGGGAPVPMSGGEQAFLDMEGPTSVTLDGLITGLESGVPTGGSEYSCIIPLHCLVSSHLHFSDLIQAQIEVVHLATQEEEEEEEEAAVPSTSASALPSTSTSYQSKIRL